MLTEHLKRPADLAARYGGEEFALILPETEAAGALMIAEACRRHLEGLQIENPAASTPASSPSRSAWPPSCRRPDSTVEQLINRADQALYAAKRGGRNSVLSADDVQD